MLACKKTKTKIKDVRAKATRAVGRGVYFKQFLMSVSLFLSVPMSSAYSSDPGEWSSSRPTKTLSLNFTWRQLKFKGKSLFCDPLDLGLNSSPARLCNAGQFTY